MCKLVVRLRGLCSVLSLTLKEMAQHVWNSSVESRRTDDSVFNSITPKGQSTWEAAEISSAPHKHLAILEEQLQQTVQRVITVWVKRTYTFSLWPSSSCPRAAQQQCCPQFSWLRTAEQPASHIPPATTQCVCVCVFSGCATVSVCPAVAHLSTTGQSHTDNNVFSVFPELMSVKTLFMTHTTYTPSSAWKYHSHAHTHTVENNCAWELGGF